MPLLISDELLPALRKVSSVLQGGEFGHTAGYSPYFKAFARQNIDGLWLTGVAITGDGSEFELHGQALQPTLVPAYFARLARETVMQGKSFSSLQLRQPQRVGADGRVDGKAADAAAAPPYVEFSLHSGAVADTAEVAGK